MIGVGALGRVGDVEGQHLALGPLGHRGARRLGQQGVAADGGVEALRHAACRWPCAGRTAGARAACRSTSGSGSRPRGRSSPSRACAGRPSCATVRARSLAATKARPGGVIRPFCEPAMATSTPQPSMSNGMQPSEATQSTISSAGCLAASIALRMAGMSLTTPEAVSICTTSMALMAWALSRFRRSSTAAGSTARRQSPFSTSTSTPIILAISPQPTREAAALQHQHGVAAREHVGERRLPAAVAVGGVDVGAALGAEDRLQVGEAAVGDADHLARVDVDGRPLHGGSTASGTLVGPGMLRNSRPLATVMTIAFRCSCAPGGAAIEPFVGRGAQVANDADIASRLARLADVAAVQDEPVVGVTQISLWDDLQQAQLDLVRRLARGEIEAMRHPEHVRVDGQGRLAEGDIEHDIGGLAADAGQRLQRLALPRHLAAVLGRSAARTAR